jgi:hypothetical protein
VVCVALERVARCGKKWPSLRPLRRRGLVHIELRHLPTAVMFHALVSQHRISADWNKGQVTRGSPGSLDLSRFMDIWPKMN